MFLFQTEKWREVLLHASSHFNSQSMIGHNATSVARESSTQRSYAGENV
jgi:hypothetical protein